MWLLWHIIITGGVATNMSTFGITSDSKFITDNVNCTGNELSIADCQRSSAIDCRDGAGLEAGVICGTTPGTCTIIMVFSYSFLFVNH